MATLGTVEVPVYAKFNGEEYEVGTVPFNIKSEPKPRVGNSAPYVLHIKVADHSNPAAVVAEVERRLTSPDA